MSTTKNKLSVFVDESGSFLYPDSTSRFYVIEMVLFHMFTFSRFHDRFLIIDESTLIHVEASLNHLGEKCFAFSSLDKSNIPDILAKI